MFKQKLKGYSLLEVLIALIVISTAMVSSVVVLVQPYKIVRENEVKSFVDSIMIRAFEFLKTNNELPVEGDFANVGNDQNINFSLREESTTNRLYLKQEFSTLSDLCIENNSDNYFYTTTSLELSSEERLKICLGITIVKIQNGNFIVTVTAKYPFRDAINTELLKTIRREGFYEK